MRILILMTCIILFLLCESFQIPKNYQRYIDTHLLKAQHLEQAYGIPVSIQFAQAIYESRGGRSPLAKKTNNHFGISCGDNWNGQRYYSNRCWRKYKTVGESWVDHACYLQHYYPKLCFESWDKWKRLENYCCEGYWNKIKGIIEQYKLYQYDQYACN